jgi:hypothetical protein
MNFDHEIQDVNLIITALEHKIRDMQLLVQKMIAKTQEQMPAVKAEIEAQTENANTTS